jgi:predicted nucleic acid-binding protein
MIAADTSALVAYFNGNGGADVEKLAAAISNGELVLPAIVVTETLSDPASARLLDAEIPDLTTLPITDGYWVRAGHARRVLKTRGFKAKVGDALIAQSCIDHDVALITRDKDFRHFAKHCGLKLA